MRIQSYIKAGSIEEAYELNQKRSTVVLGGFTWLKMQDRMVQTAVDLSGLGLEGIVETPEEFRIGAMTPLRELECHQGLLAYTDGAARDCVKHIVGVQFRNCATVGGSVFGRFGFSDVLTFFLAMDSCVELYHRGIVPLQEFAREKADRDILMNVIIRKGKQRTAYEAFRREAVDFPLTAVCAAMRGERLYVSIGARPAKAERAEFAWHDGNWVPPGPAGGREAAEGKQPLWQLAAGNFTYGGNLRASAAYRERLAQVLCRRALEKLAVLPEANV